MILLRKLLRTMLRYRAQFISMILMTALGVGMFLGFNIEWISLERDLTGFLERTGFADYRVISAEGFTEEELARVASLEGIDAAARFLSVNADVEGSENMLALAVTTNPAVSGFIVTEGEAYDASSTDGFWLMDLYAARNGVHVGDELKITYESMTITGTVRGLVKSGEFGICVRDETQLMPDFETFGFVYISPAMLEDAVLTAYRDRGGMMGEALGKNAVRKIYPQINIRSALDKDTITGLINGALERTLLILTVNETLTYAEAMGEVEEGKTMASLLPVLFLLIAILTMVTTMNRIAVNEKTQIGTLKALGFRNGRIARHYTAYALFIALVGTLLGVALGYGIGWGIMNENGMMGTYIAMDDWSLHMATWCWVCVAAMIALLTLVGYLSVRRMLEGTAADTLRPYVPKKMKRLAIERTAIWKHMGFGTRWNLRDIMRHKSRSLMTLIGVWGCAVLLVASLGMSDTMNAFLNEYFKDAACYASKVSVAEDLGNDGARALAEKLEGDWSASVSCELGSKAVSLDVYHITRGNVRFLSGQEGTMDLPEDGALICRRLADAFDVKPGDTVTLSPYGTSEDYELRIAGVTRSLTESIILSDTYAETLFSGDTQLTGSKMFVIGSVYTRLEKADIPAEGVSTIQSKQDVLDSFGSFLQIMYLMIGMLVVGAAAMALIVEYNLGVMSYTERYREMATLKVVGFRDKQIGRLLVSQNLWLSVAGILIGIPSGVGTLVWLMKMLAAEYELRMYISPVSILVSALITVGVSLLVSRMIAAKNKHIDMVAALKTQE